MTRLFSFVWCSIGVLVFLAGIIDLLAIGV